MEKKECDPIAPIYTSPDTPSAAKNYIDVLENMCVCLCVWFWFLQCSELVLVIIDNVRTEYV